MWIEEPQAWEQEVWFGLIALSVSSSLPPPWLIWGTGNWYLCFWTAASLKG